MERKATTGAAANSASALQADGRLRLLLHSVTFAARDVVLLTFRAPDRSRLPPAEAGAHIGLHLPDGIVRQYSLVTLDPEATSYTVAVKKDATSRGGSKYVHDQLRVGTILAVDPPRNNFPLAEGQGKSLLIAGGIGITPIWCMVETLRAEGRPWELWYACRTRDEAVFLNDIGNLPEAHLHIDDEASGRLLDVAALVQAVPADAHLYCCGPPPMLEAFEAATASLPPERVHLERFTSEPPPATGEGFQVRLARSGRTVDIPSGRTILEVLREAGLDLPSSCESGVCGTCETAVLEGTPDHRDSVLSDQERLDNETMMICCSRSKSSVLVLDL